MKTRTKQMPEVPTVAETIPAFESEGWFGLVAPAETPTAMTKAIHAMTVKALRDPKD